MTTHTAAECAKKVRIHEEFLLAIPYFAGFSYMDSNATHRDQTNGSHQACGRPGLLHQSDYTGGASFTRRLGF